jgi:cysteine desulfurase/selenocysteine lyase
VIYVREARDGFGPFDGRVWLNVAHQGPLPKVAMAALRDVAEQKAAPHLIRDEAFFEVPEAVKRELAFFIGASPPEIVLGNSTTYGLHLLSHGIQWREGDEVLLVDGDFPATVVPWLWLRERGVRIRLLRPRERPLDPAQLAQEISERTRVFCSSWVFSFTGETIDVAALGKVCREREVYFVLNATQGVGACPIDVTRLPVDALVSCGFKWLCGPYATGFCWIHPELLGSLDYHQDYWLAQTKQTDLAQDGGYELRRDRGADRYDVFGTANFFNFVPWQAALKLLAEVGVQAIAAHDQRLVEIIVGELDGSPRLHVVSPVSGPARSAIVIITHADPSRNEDLYATLRGGGIDVALRAGQIRLSPHLHSDEDDIHTALRLLTRHA